MKTLLIEFQFKCICENNSGIVVVPFIHDAVRYSTRDFSYVMIDHMARLALHFTLAKITVIVVASLTDRATGRANN